MRPNNSMIPKVRLSEDHATDKHDPEKLRDFSDQIMRLKCYGEIAEAWAAAGPLPLRMASGGGARPFADMQGLG